jgi:hypothetical protein
MLRSRRSAKVLLCSLLAASAASLVGCASSGRDDAGRHADVQWDMTPELLTLGQRQIDYENQYLYSWNHNNRAAWGDFNRAMMGDRPSRLHPYPATR